MKHKLCWQAKFAIWVLILFVVSLYFCLPDSYCADLRTETMKSAGDSILPVQADDSILVIERIVSPDSLTLIGPVKFGEGATGYNWPTTRGSDGQIPKLDGSGNLTFQADAAGAGGDSALYLTNALGDLLVMRWQGDSLIFYDSVHTDTMKFYHDGSGWVIDGGGDSSRVSGILNVDTLHVSLLGDIVNLFVNNNYRFPKDTGVEKYVMMYDSLSDTLYWTAKVMYTDSSDTSFSDYTATFFQTADFDNATIDTNGSGQLQVATIDSTNITDSSVAEADLNIFNDPSDEQVITWESSVGGTGGMRWEDQAGGGGTDIKVSEEKVQKDPALEFLDFGLRNDVTYTNGTTFVTMDFSFAEGGQIDLTSEVTDQLPDGNVRNDITIDEADDVDTSGTKIAAALALRNNIWTTDTDTTYRLDDDGDTTMRIEDDDAGNVYWRTGTDQSSLTIGDTANGWTRFVRGGFSTKFWLGVGADSSETDSALMTKDYIDGVVSAGFDTSRVLLSDRVDTSDGGLVFNGNGIDMGDEDIDNIDIFHADSGFIGVIALRDGSGDTAVLNVGTASPGRFNNGIMDGHFGDSVAGIVEIGNGCFGMHFDTTYNGGLFNLKQVMMLQNNGTPVGNFEWLFIESNNSIRFGIPKSGDGLGTYNPRSMIIAGPAVFNDSIALGSYWGFDALDMITGTDGADLGVQNNLQVLDTIFIDSGAQGNSITADNVGEFKRAVDSVDIYDDGGIKTAHILDQTILNEDIDTTSENFAFDGAYHITSDEADSAYITSKPVADTADILRAEMQDSAAQAFATKLVDTVRNTTGVALGALAPVHPIGEAAGYPTVDSAKSSSGATMPATGILPFAISNGSNGLIVFSGKITGINTSAPGWAVEDALYVGADGGLTNVKPTGGNLIQKVAEVIRVHSSQGTIEIVGAGRTNDLPNIPDSNFWVGNGDSVPTAVIMSGHATMSNAGVVTIDHGGIDGLGDDDHTQYLKESDTATYTADIQARISDTADVVRSEFASADNTVRSEIRDTSALVAGDTANILRAEMDDSAHYSDSTGWAKNLKETAGSDSVYMDGDTMKFSGSILQVGDPAGYTGISTGLELDDDTVTSFTGNGLEMASSSPSAQQVDTGIIATNNHAEAYADSVIDTVWFGMTIDNPDNLAKDSVMVLSVDAEWAPSGITLLSVGIKTWAVTSYSVNFMEYTEPGDGGTESLIETVATSTSREAEDDGTLSDASIAVGSIIVVELDTDNIDQVQVWGTYYVN